LSKNGCFYLNIPYGSDFITLYIINKKKKRVFLVSKIKRRRMLPDEQFLPRFFSKYNVGFSAGRLPPGRTAKRGGF